MNMPQNLRILRLIKAKTTSGRLLWNRDDHGRFVAEFDALRLTINDVSSEHDETSVITLRAVDQVFALNDSRREVLFLTTPRIGMVAAAVLHDIWTLVTEQNATSKNRLEAALEAL